MFLIIEGPDCVGKTTAAKKIVKSNHGWSGVHMTRPRDGFDHFAGYANQLRSHVVFDRFHLGALAYGIVATDERQDTSLSKLLSVCRLIKFMRGVVVVMHSGTDAWLDQRLTEEGRTEMYDRDVIMRVNDLYRWIARREHVLGTTVVDVAHDVAELGWPTEEQLRLWVEMCGADSINPFQAPVEACRGSREPFSDLMLEETSA